MASLALACAAVGIGPATAAALAQSPERSVEAAAEDGLVALDAEIMLLVELDAFVMDAPPALVDIRDESASYMEGMSDTELHEWLAESDEEGAVALGDLLAAGISVTNDVRIALGPLPPPARDHLAMDQPIGIDPLVYVRARDQLVRADGARPAGDPGGMDPAADVVSPATGAEAPGPASPRPGEVASSSASAGSGLVIVLAVAAATLLIGAIVAVLVRSRRSTERRATPRDDSDQLFDMLADATRRMTGALDADETARIALDQAMRLAGARHGAFIEIGADGLTARAVSDGLVDPRGFEGGALVRVAETGQTVRYIAHDEPAITSLPAAMLAVPIISSGRITGIVFLVRADSAPFTAAEQAKIERLTPIIGSALAAAAKHGDAAALSRLDALTGLANRRQLDEDLAEVLGSGLADTAVAMIDVDHFKHFNDRNGHAAGDAALRAVATALATSTIPPARAYRYGGEEFAVIFGTGDVAGAIAQAERIRSAVAATPIEGRAHQPGGVLSVSIGVAQIGPDRATAMSAADAALYDAKSAGRNRVAAARAQLTS